MLKEIVVTHRGVPVVIADSITKADASDAGRVVVSASHGGSSSGEFALEHALGLVLFNDAGVGKEDAGVASLDMLDRSNRPAAVIGHTSARIGDARDHWESGTITRANHAAETQGVQAGMTVREAAFAWIDWVCTHEQ
jgi:hypothetical protein